MAATSSLPTSLSVSFPLQIDFRKKEAEARLIFADQAIQEHALNALTQIQKLNTKIATEIHEYNAGNISYRKAIDRKIKTILNNYLAKENFPFTFVIDDLKVMQVFFKPLKSEYKRLREELSRSEKTLEKEKNSKLSLLLYDEQEKISSLETVFGHFLNTLKVEITDKNLKPTIYFAYAWPIGERMRDEHWVQIFFKRFRSHLCTAGFRSVHFDTVSKRNELMNKIQKSDYILLFGTESLKDKHDGGLSAICTEFIEILRKRQLDVKKGSRRVFPILISGSHKTTFPPGYERYITVRDWRKGDYLNHFQHLFLQLIGLPSGFFLKTTHSFLEKSMAVSPAEGSKMLTMQEWYSNARRQINDSTLLEEISQCSVSFPSEIAP